MKVHKLDFIQIKNFCSAKDSIKNPKRQGIGLEKILTTIDLDKSLIP